MIVNKDSQTDAMSQASITGGRGQVTSQNLPKSLRKGGRISRTGVYKLHKGEEVIPAGRAARKSGRKSGRR
jgi:hypothetical protein